jgi:hypothetical protein
MLHFCIETHDIEFDDVVDVIQNLDEFLTPIKKIKNNLPSSTIFMRLTPWINNSNEYHSYLAMFLLVSLDNTQQFVLTINDGYFCNLKNDIVEGDGFVDIKTDINSIQQAIKDMKAGYIPLHNKCQIIDYQYYPYILSEFE